MIYKLEVFKHVFKTPLHEEGQPRGGAQRIDSKRWEWLHGHTLHLLFLGEMGEGFEVDSWQSAPSLSGGMNAKKSGVSKFKVKVKIKIKDKALQWFSLTKVVWMGPHAVCSSFYFLFCHFLACTRILAHLQILEQAISFSVSTLFFFPLIKRWI